MTSAQCRAVARYWFDRAGRYLDQGNTRKFAHALEHFKEWAFRAQQRSI